jgi:hypothetical protein
MKFKLSKLFYLVITGLFFMTSCASFKMSDLKPTPKNSRILPTLQTRIDLNSFESAYSLGTSSSISVGTFQGSSSNNSNSSKISGLGTAVSSSTMSKDVRIQDAITIFDRDVKDNITDPFGDFKGYILCKINASSEKQNLGWAFLSGLTLMVPNILGMPIGAYKIVLDVDVEVYSISEKLIARYNASAYHKKYMAAYWGYGQDASRVANIMAFRDAMNQIKVQIDKDYDNVFQKLNLKTKP